MYIYTFETFYSKIIDGKIYFLTYIQQHSSLFLLQNAPFSMYS